MYAKGKTLLRFTGFLELLFGLVMLGIMFLITSAGKDASIDIFGSNPDGITFLQLGLAWAQAGFSVLAGIVAILLANKANAYKVCMFFGMILILIAMGNSFTSEFNMQTIMKELYAYIVPVFYYWGAVKNKQSVQ